MGNRNHSHHGYKTFLRALEVTQAHGTKAKKFLSDKRLSFQEKKLLAFYLKVRSNDFSYCDDLLNDTSFESLPFLKGLRHYFLGMAFVYKNDSAMGEEHLKMALPHLQECQNERFVQRLLFRVQVSLFHAYVNQKKIVEMKEKFLELDSMKRNSDEDEITFKLLRLCHSLVLGDYPTAEDIIEKMESLIPAMTEIQIMSFLIEKFDFFVKTELFLKAESVLKRMKDYRVYRLSANYQYMDKLLKFITQDARIYVYANEFVEHEDLYLMINIIKALDEADDSQASFFWSKLSQNSPKTFLPNFEYKGDKCLFSICLKKCLDKTSKMSTFVLSSYYSKHARRLINLLLEAPGGLKKEFLFSEIYGKEMSSKDDLIALSSVIYRINKKGELTIKSKNGSFFIFQDKSKSA